MIHKDERIITEQWNVNINHFVSNNTEVMVKCMQKLLFSGLLNIMKMLHE